MNALIEVQGLHKNFGSHAVLQRIDLSIRTQETTVIVGRSGCGKSTLLRCMNGLEPFDGGQIQVADWTVTPENQAKLSGSSLRRYFGMVFQSFNLFPHLNLLENVMKAPRVVMGLSFEEARSIALPLIDKVGLSKHTDQYPAQLSGGQQQRAAIARALAMSPKVMLYDEPTSALDPWLVDEVLGVMKTLSTEGMTQVVVTHEMRFARDVADQVAFIDHGEVVEVAAPEQMFSNPRDERTRDYLKRFLN